MGVEPFLVASSINCILAQRLARRICTQCVEEISVAQDVLLAIGIPPDEAATMKVKHGKGCDRCANTGYKGRIALYEVMPMKEEVREFVLNGASSAEIKREAIRLGMLTLRASALMRLREGTTTVEEVLRVTVSD
jgi:type IV pilus assembly protein PilB